MDLIVPTRALGQGPCSWRGNYTLNGVVGSPRVESERDVRHRSLKYTTCGPKKKSDRYHPQVAKWQVALGISGGGRYLRRLRRQAGLLKILYAQSWVRRAFALCPGPSCLATGP